jgi:hypothetical protein
MLSNRVVVILAVAFLCAGRGPDPRALDGGNPSDGQHAAESDALRRGGIAAAAALKGHYESTVSADPENNVETLAQLVAWHSLILIGRIESNHSWLTGDGESIVTDYKVAVERVLKGDRARRITVSVPGGRVSFPDGSMATLTSTMRTPLNGERYLLFLVPSWFPPAPGEKEAAGGPIYAPQHLSLSMYLMDPGGRVMPRGKRGHPLQREMGKKTETGIIQEIATLTRGR